MSQEAQTPTHDENHLIAERRDKLQQLRSQGNAYPNDFRRQHYAADLHQAYGEKTKEELAENDPVIVTLAGRMMLRRIMGKASFATLQDMTGRIQIYVSRDDLPEGIYNEGFKKWDLGDILGVTGHLFKTNTGELSIHATSLRILTKSLRPLPDKFHGLTDQEMRYRQRYVDLMVNEESRNTFKIRSQVIQGIRNYFMDQGYIEAETPMMHIIPGGAAARPFQTHHNALDMPLFLRIAPELYLKRLVVGGFEKVFEINRNFRNEGVSTRHNPEFTMLEFYEAYADYVTMMDHTETLFRKLSQDILGTTQIHYQGLDIDFGQPFARMSILQSICHYHPEISLEQLQDRQQLIPLVQKLGQEVRDDMGLGKLQTIVFEELVEEKLLQPTFITQYPAEVSPLARRNDHNPDITDRFELFIGGREIANGFSELNDPEDQAERFMAQVQAKDAGDAEAMHYDADYINALEYGLPPTAGEGIGIDRLVMLFTNSPSIRDVLLFPHMRHKAQE